MAGAGGLCTTQESDTFLEHNDGVYSFKTFLQHLLGDLYAGRSSDVKSKDLSLSLGPAPLLVCDPGQITELL